MPGTFEALGVLLVATMPGALYVWGYERQVGQWGLTATDRFLRFLGWSALLHLALAPLSYWLWTTFIRTGRLRRDDHIPIYLWGVFAVYLVVPVLAGSLFGQQTRKRTRFGKLVAGPNPAPRAWDNLFGDQDNGWIRLKLKSGPWIGGLYGRFDEEQEGASSYAAGYPYDQDLYVARAIEIDQDSGAFLYSTDGEPEYLPSGILVRWSEVEYLDFAPVEER